MLKLFFFTAKENFIGFIISIIILIIIFNNRNKINRYFNENFEVQKEIKLREFENLSINDVKSIFVFNIPNQDVKSLDSICISNRDSIATIVTQIKNAKKSTLSHPSVSCDFFLTMNFNNGNKLNFKILNSTDNGIVIILISDRVKVEKFEIFRNDKFEILSNELCDKLIKLSWTHLSD